MAIFHFYQLEYGQKWVVLRALRRDLDMDPLRPSIAGYPTEINIVGYPLK
jgi:hypothetical protein